MIKSKIDARERALEMAVELCKGLTGNAGISAEMPCKSEAE